MMTMSTAELLAELDAPARGLTRREYDVLVEEGLLEDQKVELLRGMIVEMSPTWRPHGLAVQWLNMWMAKRLPDHLHVRVHSGWAATDDSEPEPDLAIVPADWATRESEAQHPRLASLIIEVAESSLRRDLRVKAGIYAEAGLAEYWVFDVAAREVVVHTDPVDGAYRSIHRAAAPEVLRAAGVGVPLEEMIAFTFPNPEPPRRAR